jgi:hypothetical protein
MCVVLYGPWIQWLFVASITLTGSHYETNIISNVGVTPPKLTLDNPVESLAIHPVEPTCDHMGNHPYKNVRVNAKESK